ncbi:TetR/AcrR family transcriptional regulator [Marivita sp. S2033]|uniref:TetR/AcrR family transcriptional regulator n=1 Tax=Marivita sp. S2033 TaxID=3373187 RepID=UPI003982A598
MSFERHSQKSRTRTALLATARRILSDKGTLTIPEVAEAAGISRATAYRYFSDPSVLAAEAGIDVSTKPYEDIVRDCTDTRERVLAVALFFFDQAVEHEGEFRSFLSSWLESWRLDSDAPTRGGRRVAMFNSALEDARDKIGDEVCERLVRELSVATGTEAMIALLDVVGTDPATARATIEHMVGALLNASLGGPQTGGDRPDRA